jgi:hypothetical protein
LVVRRPLTSNEAKGNVKVSPMQSALLRLICPAWTPESEPPNATNDFLCGRAALAVVVWVSLSLNVHCTQHTLPNQTVTAALPEASPTMDLCNIDRARNETPPRVLNSMRSALIVALMQHQPLTSPHSPAAG